VAFHSVEVKDVSVRSGESRTLPPVTIDVSKACQGPYPPQWLEPMEGRSASGELTATVSDRRGKPLAGVRVRLQDGTHLHSVITDAQGNFRIVDLAPGLYELNLHRQGYWDSDDKDLRVQGGFIAVYGPYRPERCPLGWCIPALRRRKIIRCE